jgi:hypothetical protein
MFDAASAAISDVALAPDNTKCRPGTVFAAPSSQQPSSGIGTC